jgi:amino-acid N-acetyltransferase
MNTITKTRITYRIARLSDVDAIKALLEAAHLPRRKVKSYVDNTIVAEKDGVLVATGTAEVHANTAVVRSVAVDEAQRGSGIGRRLAEELLDFGRRNGVEQFYLFTGDAHSFWQKLGFEDTTLDAWPEPARTCWQYAYVVEHWAALRRMGVYTMSRRA